jgi:ribulose bisphosphate carboxylase small subunit
MAIVKSALIRFYSLILLFQIISGISTSESSVKVKHNLFQNETSSPYKDHDTCRSTSSTLFEQILASDYEGIDPLILPNCVTALKDRGAHRCWHKHSTFLDHLLGVHNMLRLWGQGSVVGRVGLFHSAYSNSYVNLALFDPSKEREIVQHLIGNKAEELVHLFCIIDRQDVVVNTLLRYGFIPKEGLFVNHLRKSNEKVFLSAETLHMLVVFSMADTADQYFGWQDALFGGGGSDGSMIIPGHDFPERHNAKALWPGISKPGLWLNYVSDLGRVARTIEHPTYEVPPIFNRGEESIALQDEIEARDLYWSVVTGEVSDEHGVISTLQNCCSKNQWVFEPLVMLAQIFLHRNEYELAANAASRALELQNQWGTAWDKRLSFGAWVAWTRVMLQRATRREPWPTNSWDVNNFGLVQ